MSYNGIGLLSDRLSVYMHFVLTLLSDSSEDVIIVEIHWKNNVFIRLVIQTTYAGMDLLLDSLSVSMNFVLTLLSDRNEDAALLLSDSTQDATIY